MKLTVDRDVLAEVVAWTARALPHHPTVPALAGLLIDAADGTLRLSAFDYDVSARATINADIAEPGRVLISGRMLAEIVKALPHKPVELSQTGAEVTLTCGPAKFTLLTMPVEDYPTLPSVPPATGVVDAAVLREAIGQVVVATGKDDTLPMLTGVRVEVSGGRVTFAATDRYRMAARVFAWDPATADAELGAMIPARTLQEVARGLGSGPVTVGLADTMAGFESAGRTTTTRLLDPEFPKWEALIGKDFPIEAMVDVAQLADAVKRVAVVAERNTPVRLAFSDGSVLVRAGSGEEAQAAEALPVDFAGDPFEVAFNHAFLGDALGCLTAPRAHMRMQGPAKPALLTGEGQPDYRHLVMAIRLS